MLLTKAESLLRGYERDLEALQEGDCCIPSKRRFNAIARTQELIELLRAHIHELKTIAAYEYVLSQDIGAAV